MEKTTNKPLKLNYKRTFIIGLCFFTILLLWQVYNSQCPIMLNYLLRDKFGGTEAQYDYIVGVIMALDNLVAIFMIPLTGYLSDKTKTKLGKRMPYIIVGTVLSVIAFPFIVISFVLDSLVGLIISMACVLIFMYLYRGPAVSLMPDITPKPLRSSANGIINFVGYIGAIMGGAIYFVQAFKIPDYDKNGGYKNNMNYFDIILPFILVSILMIIALIILVSTIKENKILEEMKDEMKRGEELSTTADKVEENKPMTKKNKKDLFLILTAVLLWFMAFNAVETFWSIYCTQTIGNDKSSYTLPTTIMVISSLLTFIPGSMLSNKIGRKYTIVIGIVCCLACMTTSCFINQPNDFEKYKILIIILFIIAGIGWALINVASYPMVVELSPNSKIGKFTGYYYTASMFAQTVTPIVIGAIMSFSSFGRKALFPYSTILFALALIAFMFISNVKPKKENNKKGFEALDND